MSWKQYLELTELARNKGINFLVHAEKACENGLISHKTPQTITEKEYNLLKKGFYKMFEVNVMEKYRQSN